MSNPDKEEINKIAKEFVELRERANKSKSKKIKSKFAEFQEFVIKKISHLVLLRTKASMSQASKGVLLKIIV